MKKKLKKVLHIKSMCVKIVLQTGKQNKEGKKMNKWAVIEITPTNEVVDIYGETENDKSEAIKYASKRWAHMVCNNDHKDTSIVVVLLSTDEDGQWDGTDWLDAIEIK